MCGIVGYVGHQNAVPILIEGLHRLEYRGYDSAGLALHRKHGIEVHKRQGKVREMEASLPKRFAGVVGVGHTRWATHGVPSDENAHPQTDASGRVAVVHNGIIENAHELRVQLEARGVEFASETDTEVLAQLIAAVETDSLEEAVRTALRSVTGTYGIAVMDARHPEQIVVARNGSPVILGIGDKEMFVASDASALVRHTQQAIYLDDGEIAVVEARAYRVTTLDAAPSAKQPTTLAVVAFIMALIALVMQQKLITDDGSVSKDRAPTPSTHTEPPTWSATPGSSSTTAAPPPPARSRASPSSRRRPPATR